MARANFTEQFEAMLMASEAGRPATIDNTPLRELIENRSPADYKGGVKSKVNSAIRFFTTAGLIDKTPAEIAADPVAFKNAMAEAVKKTSSSQGGNNQKFLSGIMESAGHGTSWPRNTLLAQFGDQAREMFDLDVQRSTVHGMPRDVYQRLKESVIALNASGDKEAATQLIMHMLGGYRPADLNDIKLENLDFETGIIRNVEIKDAGKTTLKTLILPDPILDAVRDFAGDRRTGLLFEDTKRNATRINAMFDKMFPADYLTISSEKLGTRTEPMRVKKLRNVNESILSALQIPLEVRNVLTGRAPATVGEAYADDIAQLEFVKDTGANSLAIFTGGSATSSPAQFMADLGVKVSSESTRGIRVTQNILRRAGLTAFVEETDPEYLKTLPQSGSLTGNQPIESDPKVTEAQNRATIARLEKQEGEDIIATAERADEVTAAKAKLAQTKTEQKAEAAAKTNEQTRSSLLNKAMKYGKPILKVVAPPVGYGVATFAADQTRSAVVNSALADQARRLGIPEAAIQTAGVVAGATEFLPVTPTDVISVAKSIPTDPSMMQEARMRQESRQFDFGDEFGNIDPDTGQAIPTAPVNIPDPAPPARPSFMEAGAAKERVNLATRAAEQGQETTMTGSFLNNP
jgi:hypothetical protein